MTSTLLAKPMIPAGAQTAAFTAVGGRIYPINATTADVPATLPVGARQGARITFTRSDSSSHSATITAGGSDVINSGTGSVTSLSLSGGQGHSVTLVADGSGHWTIAQQTPGIGSYAPIDRYYAKAQGGCKGDGTTDDTAAISAAMDAAQSAGKALFFEPGTYLSGIITKAYALPIEATRGTVTIQATNTSSWTWNFSGGGPGTGVALTSNLAQNVAQVAVTTTGFTAGSTVLIGDNTAPDANNPLRYQGFISRVYSVDSGSQLTLTDLAYNAFTTAQTAKIYPVALATGAKISGLHFAMPSAVGATGTGGFLRLTYCENVDVDITGDGASAAGVYLRSCYHGRVRHTAKNYWDNSITGLQQYGYGVCCAAATSHFEVDVLAERVRHAYTNTGEDNYFGEPYNIRVTGVAHGCTSQAWDAHAGGKDISFVNCHAYGTRSYGFSLRGSRQSINGGIADGGYGGVWLFDFPNDLQIRNLKISNIKNTDANDTSAVGGNAILSAQPCAGLIIADCDISQIALTAISIKGGGVTDAEIYGNRIRNVGLSAVSGEKYGLRLFSACTRLKVYDNVIADNQGTPTTIQGFQVDSAGTDVAFWDNAILNSITPINSVTGLRWGPQFVSKAWTRGITTVAFASTVAFDAATSGAFLINPMTGSVTSSSITNAVDGAEITIMLLQDGTGSRTFSWPGNVKWTGAVQPTLTTTANRMDIFTFVYRAATGNWYEKSAQLNIG